MCKFSLKKKNIFENMLHSSVLCSASLKKTVTTNLSWLGKPFKEFLKISIGFENYSSGQINNQCLGLYCFLN